MAFLIPPTAYLARPQQPTVGTSVVRWWEQRRLYYNVILLLWLLILSVSSLHKHTASESLWGSRGYILPFILLLQVPANLWYTCSWMLENMLRTLWPKLPGAFSTVALAFGTGFSLWFAWYIVNMPSPHI